MVFSSNEFLFLYLPLSLFLYFLVPIRFTNLALFLVSLVFYGWEKPVYLFIMVFVIIVNYVFGFLIGRAENAASKKRALVWGVVLNVATLGFFKYEQLGLENPLTGVSPMDRDALAELQRFADECMRSR